MYNWEKFDEITIPPNEAFYNKLNLEGISDADYAHAPKSMVSIWNNKSQRVS